MNESEASTDESLVERLAEEYLTRLQNGERPSIRDYTQRHPEWAEEIRDLFNTLVMMEDLAPDPEDLADQAAPWSTETPTSLGEYRILRELGRGGMGVVFEAEHSSLRRRVALKVLHRRAAGRGHDLERFMREARSAGRLHHTNIVPVFEVGSDDGTHFYAMQCIRGQNLDLVIADLKQIHQGQPHEIPHAPTDRAPSGALSLLSGSFTRHDIGAETVSDVHRESTQRNTASLASLVPHDSSRSDSYPNIVVPDSSDMSNVGAKQENYFHRVARIGLQVAEALAYAHDQGVLHRDIKPSNLILDTTGVVWVTDFGLARSEGEDLTHTGDIVGTLRYMAPERFQGDADERADIYSLGLTLYELCTLQHAFDRSDRAELIRQVTQQDPTRPRLVNASIPNDLETIVLKGIARDPDARYRSAGEMAEDLRLFLADRPIQARRASYVEQTWRWCRRNPGFASMLASIAMLLMVLLCGSIAFAVTTRQHADQIEQQSETVRQAHRESRRSLFDSYIDQAKASRWSGRRGQRFETLDAIVKATELLPQLEFSPDQVEERKFALRNEAIAALPLTDMRITHQWPATSIARCAISNDGQLIATPEQDGQVLVRQVDTDRLLARLHGPKHPPWRIQIDPTSKHVAAWYHDSAGGGPRTVVVWHIESELPVITIDKQLDRGQFEFDRNGEAIAIRRRAGRIDLFSLNPEHDQCFDVVHSFEVDPSARSMKFTPQGELAVSVENSIQFFRHDGQPTGQVIHFPASPRSINFITTERMVVGCADEQIYIHDSTSGEMQNLAKHTGVVVFTNPSSDRRFLASEAWGGTRYLWNLATGDVQLRLDGLDFGWGEFCNQSHRAAFTEPLFRHGIWEVASGDQYKEIPADSIQSIQGITPHPIDDSIFVVLGTHLEVWDINRGQRLAQIENAQSSDAVFAPDGKTLYYAMVGKQRPQQCPFEIAHDPENHQRIVRLGEATRIPGLDVQRPAGRGQHIAIDATGQHLAAFDYFGYVRVSDVTQDDQWVKLSAQRFANRLTLSPDGRTLVTGTWHGRGVRVSDAVSGELIRELETDVRSAWVQFSPDGKWLMVSGEEGDTCWDTSTWTAKPIAGDLPDGGVCKIAFSPDSRLAAIAQSSFVRRLVDPTTGTTVAILEGPSPAAARPAFSASGRFLVEAVDGRLQVWDLQSLRSELKPLGLDWK